MNKMNLKEDNQLETKKVHRCDAIKNNKRRTLTRDLP